MSTCRMLYVEDDPDASNMMRIYFQQHGYEVAVAQRGEDALEMCRQQLPNIIVLDIMLPDMDGYDVCRELRGNLRTSHIPIVFLSQKDERSDKIHGLELGADDYITKPFDLVELTLRIKNAAARTYYESLTNPTTGLPSGRLIEDQLRQLMRRDDWGIIYVGIRGFSTFGEKYGFVAGEEVLRFASTVLGRSVDSVGTPNNFIGHIGGDDFIIITHKDALVPIVEDIRQCFSAGVGDHYDRATRQQGYLVVRDKAGYETKVDLMSLSAGTVSSADGPFADIREITEVAWRSREMAQKREALSTGINQPEDLIGLEEGDELLAQLFEEIWIFTNIEEHLQGLLHHDDWALLYVGINDIAPFCDKKGSLADHDVLCDLTRMMRETVGEFGTSDDLISWHGKGVVVITTRELGPIIRHHVIARFDEIVGAYYTPTERKNRHIIVQGQRYPLMSLAVGLVSAADGPFVSTWEIAEAATKARLAAHRERDTLTQKLYRLIARRDQLRELVEIHREGYGFVLLLDETSKLTAGVTHDLKSGLGIIKNTVGFMLQEVAEDNPVREDLERMNYSYGYCEALLQDLLELGFDRRMQPQLVNLEDAIQNAISVLRAKMSPDIDLKVSLAPAKAYGDKDQFQQVFVNLIRRAIASSHEGQLSITIEPVAGDYVPVKVVSSAFEVAQSQQGRVFDLGFMLDERGYNIDLFVVKKILTRHNAAIEAMSKQEAGTEFVILLPLRQPEDRWLTVNGLRARIGDVEGEVKALAQELEAFHQERPDTPLPLSEVNRLVSGLASALLNEVWVIENSVELMLQDFGWQDDEKEDLIRINTSCQYCELLVRNLLEIGLEKKAETPQIVDATLILREVVRLLEGKMAPGVQVRWELNGAMPGLLGNELQLKQVFMNLVRNALDAMPESGVLTIRTDVQNTLVQIQVVDTGCGILDENLEKVFSLPFTTKREGYGIGLHIVKSIVSKHGGEVKVKSQVGEGTTFTVRLPIKQEGIEEDV